jgi:glycosyltransferase involved in cell wall biosynthesis
VPTYGILSTYPPTQCGLATFSRALGAGLARPGSGDRVGIVRVLDTAVRSAAPEVVGTLHAHSRGGAQAAAAHLNAHDVAVIQHEYGIYGGPDGDQVLAVLDQLRVPVIAVMHSAPKDPTPHQAQVLRSVIAASDAIVALTDAARQRLVGQYGADPSTVHVIRHGATPYPSSDSPSPARRPLILTWGLLGPGKGIEWAIDGLQRLRYRQPLPAYIVAGRTHPRVHLEQGESYRLKLAQRARIVGVSHLFRSVSSYLDDDALGRLIRRADVILLPYDSRDQANSPVLVEAVAAGKPVVATAFPHAVELLGDGAGLLVPHYDAAAIGEALHRVLTEPGLACRLATAAARLAPMFSWPEAAERYRALATALLANKSTVDRNVEHQARSGSPTS